MIEKRPTTFVDSLWYQMLIVTNSSWKVGIADPHVVTTDRTKGDISAGEASARVTRAVIGHLTDGNIVACEEETAGELMGVRLVETNEGEPPQVEVYRGNRLLRGKPIVLKDPSVTVMFGRMFESVELAVHGISEIRNEAGVVRDEPLSIVCQSKGELSKSFTLGVRDPRDPEPTLPEVLLRRSSGGALYISGETVVK